MDSTLIGLDVVLVVVETELGVSSVFSLPGRLRNRPGCRRELKLLDGGGRVKRGRSVVLGLSVVVVDVVLARDRDGGMTRLEDIPGRR